MCCVIKRSTSEGATPLELEIKGESCVPRIDGERVESIFEEHTIVERLDQSMHSTGVPYFATLERVFSFGAVLASCPGGTPAEGVRANIKITNPGKVRLTPIVYLCILLHRWRAATCTEGPKAVENTV
jgi:hydrocephalus-inducing protein